MSSSRKFQARDLFMAGSEHAPVSQAFVLGAGLGTRLKRLTAAMPKPLVPVAGRPLITYAFDQLIAVGIRKLVVNTHHCAEEYARAFPESQYRGVPIHFRHEPELLETGGGIKNVEDLLGKDPFIVYNGDILSTLPLQPAIDFHSASGNKVTLLLRNSGGPLSIRFEPNQSEDKAPSPTGRATDIHHRLGVGESTHLFTGIYLVDPAFLSLLTLEKASVVSTFLQLIQEEGSLGAIVINEGEWWDVGNREQYLAVHRHFEGTTLQIDPTAKIHPSAVISKSCWIGPRVEVEAGAILDETIIWEGAKIAQDNRLTRCIVTAHQRVPSASATPWVDCDF